MREVGPTARSRYIAVGLGVLLGVVVLLGALMVVDVWLHPEETSPLGALDDGTEVQRVDRHRWLTGDETELRVVLGGETLGSAPLELPRLVSTHGAWIVAQDEHAIVIHDRTLRVLGRVALPRDVVAIDWTAELLVVRVIGPGNDSFSVHALPTGERLYEVDDLGYRYPVLVDGRLFIERRDRVDEVTGTGLARLTPVDATDVGIGAALYWVDAAGQHWAQLLEGAPVALAWGTLPGDPPRYGPVVACDGGTRFVGFANAIFELRGWRRYVASFDSRTGARQWLARLDDDHPELDAPCAESAPGRATGWLLPVEAPEPRAD